MAKTPETSPIFLERKKHLNQNFQFLGGVPCSFSGGCIYFPTMLKELEILNHEVGGAYSHLNSSRVSRSMHLAVLAVRWLEAR